MAQSAEFQTTQKNLRAEKIVVQNLEAKAADGNPVFTPKQWLERFRHFTKREHKIDITPLIKGEDVTETGWTGKKKPSRKTLSREWDPKHCVKSPESSIKRIRTVSKLKTQSDYSSNITYRIATPTKTEETSFGRNRQKKKDPKTSGED